MSGTGLHLMNRGRGGGNRSSHHDGCVETQRVSCPCAGCGQHTSTTHISAADLKLYCPRCCPICNRQNSSQRKETGRAIETALYRMHEIAAAYFQECLSAPSAAEARDYVKFQDITDEIEAFGIGFAELADGALTRRLIQEGFTSEQLEASGLVRRRAAGSCFDYFRGRVIFPIHNESGRVIAFAGRALRDDQQPKYLTSAATAIHHPASVLYNLHRAKDAIRRTGRVVLVDGFAAAIRLFGSGTHEVVATRGTPLTTEQARAIRRHARTVVLNFEVARGQAAEYAIRALCSEGLDVRVWSEDPRREVPGDQLSNAVRDGSLPNGPEAMS